MSTTLTMKNILFLSFTVVLLSAGQILVKAGIQRTSISESANFFGKLFPLFLQPLVLGGLLTTALSTAFYFTVLSEVNLSIAYPFISFSYVVVLLLSSLLFHEHISKFQIAGIISIVIGIFFLSRAN